MRLFDKTAIITGGNGTLGWHTARIFAEEGAHVYSLDVQHSAAIPTRTHEAPGSIKQIQGDVRSTLSWTELIARVTEERGDVDVLINVAALDAYGVSDPWEVHAWDRILDVNLKGAALGMAAVIPSMLKRGKGSIVNVGSVVALAGLPAGHLAYTGSKAGLSAITRAVAVRYGSAGIRANTVHPGLMAAMRNDGPAAQSLAAPNTEAVVRRVPLGRAAAADEVAETILFLASDAASYVTGIDLAVDGGFTAT